MQEILFHRLVLSSANVANILGLLLEKGHLAKHVRYVKMRSYYPHPISRSDLETLMQATKKIGLSNNINHLWGESKWLEHLSQGDCPAEDRIFAATGLVLKLLDNVQEFSVPSVRLSNASSTIASGFLSAVIHDAITDSSAVFGRKVNPQYRRLKVVIFRWPSPGNGWCYNPWTEITTVTEIRCIGEIVHKLAPSPQRIRSLAITLGTAWNYPGLT